MDDLTPRRIVSELDRHIVGQDDAKRAVALALRNRWRRRRLDVALRDEVTPKNILLIGPTGVGKTEIARRLARLARAPFLKVEATKFTEVGYVGRDVEQIVRDLLEASISIVKEARRRDVRERAEAAAEERVLTALVGDGAQASTREAFRRRLRAGELDDREIDLDLPDTASPLAGLDGVGPGGMGIANLGELLSRTLSGRTRRARLRVREAFRPLLADETDKLLDQEAIVREAVELAEQEGVVFIDEIDKIAARAERAGADVSREGVQRDLLPLIEGTTVTTKHGPVRTDFILFIASGAFQVAKPSDLLPELQGRLPIRVELKALTQGDFRRILTEPEANLVRQYQALLETEGVRATFDDSAIDAIAEIAVSVNDTLENIGARRLHTVIERALEELSFTAPERSGETVIIDGAAIRRALGDIAADRDLSRYIL
jgi:ATP-dependent HslUV protease ATP-binding subunit HslU